MPAGGRPARVPTVRAQRHGRCKNRAGRHVHGCTDNGPGGERGCPAGRPDGAGGPGGTSPGHRGCRGGCRGRARAGARSDRRGRRRRGRCALSLRRAAAAPSAGGRDGALRGGLPAAARRPRQRSVGLGYSAERPAQPARLRDGERGAPPLCAAAPRGRAGDARRRLLPADDPRRAAWKPRARREPPARLRRPGRARLAGAAARARQDDSGRPPADGRGDGAAAGSVSRARRGDPGGRSAGWRGRGAARGARPDRDRSRGAARGGRAARGSERGSRRAPPSPRRGRAGARARR